ncbi:MAG TPA: hypothetical protein VGH07_04915, partial [Chthoniobacterales bacterium]
AGVFFELKEFFDGIDRCPRKLIGQEKRLAFEFGESLRIVRLNQSQGGSLVTCLITDNLNDLHPLIVQNPRVGSIQIPQPAVGEWRINSQASDGTGQRPDT